jgi:hypothetical protein
MTFQMSEVTIYNWLEQERIDRGEAEGATTSQQLELAAAKRRIRQLETELAVATTRSASAAWSSTTGTWTSPSMKRTPACATSS